MAGLVFAVAVGLRAASAETKIESKIVEFDVPGVTAAEVSANLDRFGPKDMYLGRAYATTTADTRWAVIPKETDKGCAAAGAAVIVDITIRVPRMVDASKMSPKLKLAFSAYVKNLMGHERGHEKRVIAAAQRIDKRIRGLPPQPSCNQLRQKASAIGFDVFQELDHINRAYDKNERRRLDGDLRFPSD